MSLPARIDRLRGLAARRAALIALAYALAAALAAAAVAFRIGGSIAAIAAALVAALLAVIAQWPQLRAHTVGWLLRQLDAVLPELEDSSALLLASDSSLTDLQRLQRQRIAVRLTTLPLPDLRAAWPWRRLAIAWLLALAVLATAALLQLPQSQATSESANPGKAAVKPDSHSVAGIRLRIEPPRYTGLPAREETALDARLPAGSRLVWTLRLADGIHSAQLEFENNTPLALKSDGGAWTAERLVDAPLLYRVVADGGDAALHRLDVIPDAPPQIELREPEHTLNEVAQDQKTWTLEFEARDDYGLGAAELRIQRTEGSGENIAVKSETQVIEGSGDAKDRRYRATLDIAKLGLEKGQDLIVRLAVADNREPEPNHALGPAVLLRWPVDAPKESSGMEGLVRQSAPAYFRSERQLIIDTEALLAQRDTLDDKHFSSRGDELGVDQKMLRLRYGQFLGEEFEGDGEHAPAGVKAPTNPNEAGEATAPSTRSAADQVVAEYGHMHDKPEAATLLDETTRKLLKHALDQMWQAELQLRSAKTDAALPYEHAALEAIKQVQQATRIYLARSGLQLPEPDPARRLTGKRDGLQDTQAPALATDADRPAREAWRALASGAVPDWTALAAWAKQKPDALALRAAIDRAPREPGCAGCLDQLRAQLWPLLPPPAAGVAPRAAGGDWLVTTP